MLSARQENVDADVDKKGHIVRGDVTYSCHHYADVEDGTKVGAVAVSNIQQCVSEEKDGKQEEWKRLEVGNILRRRGSMEGTPKKECQRGNHHWRRSFKIDCNDADICHTGYGPTCNRYQHNGSLTWQGMSSNRVYGGLATICMGFTMLTVCSILFPAAVVPLITYQGDTLLQAQQQTPTLDLQNVGMEHDEHQKQHEHKQQGVIEQQQPQFSEQTPHPPPLQLTEEEVLLQPYGFPKDPSSIFQNVRTIQDTLSNQRPLEEDGDVIFYWSVSQAAGSALTDMLDFCFRKIRAEKVRDPPSMDIVYATQRHSLVNMDTNSPQAIALAKEMHLLESDDVNVFQSAPSPVYTQTIESSFLWEAATLFTPHHKGRVITILRHPVERDVSMYHKMVKATREPTYNGDFQQMTLLEYATTQHRHGDNWLVRLLTHDKHGRITEGHVDFATDLLRKYCLVGFLNPLDKGIFAKSVSRIQRYLQLEAENPGCIDQFIRGSGDNMNLNGNGTSSAEHLRHGMGSSTEKNGAHKGLTPDTRNGPLLEGSPEWNALATLHQFDLMLYENAKQIYQEQTQMLGMEYVTI
jgi:hypothetical protein